MKISANAELKFTHLVDYGFDIPPIPLLDAKFIPVCGDVFEGMNTVPASLNGPYRVTATVKRRLVALTPQGEVRSVIIELV